MVFSNDFSRKELATMNKKILPLALAGMLALSFSTGCFGGDSKDGGIVQSAQVMMDTAKAIIKAGKQLAEWDTQTNELITSQRETLKKRHNKAYTAYADAVVDFNKNKSEKDNNDGYSKMCKAQKALLLEMSKDKHLPEKVSKQAGELAAAYDKIWQDMTQEMGKNLSEDVRKEITEAVIKEMTK